MSHFYIKKSAPEILPPQKQLITCRHCFEICLLRITNTTESLKFYFIFATHLQKKKMKSGRPPN